MTTQSTPNLGLSYPDPGTEDDNWGDILNALFLALDDHVGGVLTKSVAGAADVTLSDAEAAHHVLKLTGTLTGNIALIVPAKQRNWRIRNGTSGNFTVTVKTASGTGATLTQGRWGLFDCDGTNVARQGELPSAMTAFADTLLDDASAAAMRTTLGIPGSFEAVSANDTLEASDRGKVWLVTGPITIAFQAAATLGDGWLVDLMEAGGGDVTLDPNGSETIDGATTAVLPKNGRMRVRSNGTALYSEPSGIGRHTVGIGAAGLVPATTGGADHPAQAETTTNKVNYRYLAFDKDAIEYAHADFPTPPGWDGGALFGVVEWTHPTASTNFGVVWTIQLLSVGDNESIDTAWGTGVDVADTGGTAGRLYRTAVTAAITPGGTPAASERLFVRVSRKATAGADTLAVDAHLVGLTLFYRAKRATDD